MRESHIKIEVVTLNGGAIKIKNTSDSADIVIDDLIFDGEHICYPECLLVSGASFIHENRGDMVFTGLVP